jgi:hypothetical protein
MAPPNCRAIQFYVDYNTTEFVQERDDFAFFQNIDWHAVDHTLTARPTLRQLLVIRVLPVPEWEEAIFQQIERNLPNFTANGTFATFIHPARDNN